jgi:hypothetical protein
MLKSSPLVKRITIRIAGTDFVRRAMAEKADLSAFKERPSAAVLAGLSLIGFSYIIGWPAVAGLGAMAVYLQRPSIALIGGPLTYGLSHLVFMLGFYFCGNRYPVIFLRWLVRVTMEKVLAKAELEPDR